MKIKRNYLRLSMILFITIILTLLFCNLYKNSQKSKINEGYLTDYVSNIKYSELKNALIEVSNNTFIYLTYTGNQSIYNTEKDMKKVIKQKNIEENFIYVNCTDLLKDSDYLNQINNLIKLPNGKITKLPALIYYRDSTPINFIDSSAHELNASDLSKIIDEYEIGTTTHA